MMPPESTIGDVVDTLTELREWVASVATSSERDTVRVALASMVQEIDEMAWSGFGEALRSR